MRQSLLTCTQCGSILPPGAIAAGEPVSCAQCGALHLIAAFEAALRETFPPEHAETAVDAAESTCFHHAGNRAADTCADCGRILCRLCALKLLVPTLCPDCLVRRMEAGDAPELQHDYPRHDLLALMVALFPVSLALLMSPLMLGDLFFGVGAITILVTLAALPLVPLSLALAVMHGRRATRPTGGRNWAVPLTVAVSGTLLLVLLAGILLSLAPIFFVGEPV